MTHFSRLTLSVSLTLALFCNIFPLELTPTKNNVSGEVLDESIEFILFVKDHQHMNQSSWL